MEDKKRRHIVKEIIETERAYVSYLALLVKAYAKPLKEFSKAGKEIIDVKSVRIIFSDVEMIHLFNSQLLADLSAAAEAQSPLGDIFIRMGKGLKLYTAYINNYGTAQQELKRLQTHSPSFRQWLEQTKNQNLEGHKRNDLTSLLVMPIQRIPRYILLLKDLQRSTEDDKQEYAKLGEAVELVSEVAQYIEQSKRTSDNFLRLAEIQRTLQGFTEKLIQPHRRLIHEGKVAIRKQGINGSIQRMLYLFNDIFIVAKPEEKDSKSGLMMQFKCLSPISEVSYEKTDMDQCEFRLQCSLTSLNASPVDTELIIVASSPAHAQEWMAKFDEAIAEMGSKWNVKLETNALLGDKRRIWLHASASARCGDLMYFFGGSTASRFRKALWTLDLKDFTWTRRKKTGKGPSSRRGHSATAVNNDGEDYIVLIGGIDGRSAMSDIHVFQCSTWSWMPEKVKLANAQDFGPRSGHTATPVGNSIFVLGGMDDSGVHYGDLSVLSVSAWLWDTGVATSGKAPPGLCGHSATAVGRRIFVLGGRKSDGEPSRLVYILDTETMTWSVGPEFPALVGHKASAIEEDIFLFGGASAGQHGQRKQLFVFRTDSLTWEQINVASVKDFPEIEENYSLMLSPNRALLVHPSHPLNATSPRQSYSLDSAITVLRLEPTEKRMKLLSSPTVAYASSLGVPDKDHATARLSATGATTTTTTTTTKMSPRRTKSVREKRRSRYNTFSKITNRRLNNEEESASEGRSSVDFSAESDSDSNPASARPRGSCSSDSGRSEASPRTVSPRVTLDLAASQLNGKSLGSVEKGRPSLDGLTSEEESDGDKKRSRGKLANKWKRLTRSFSVGTMFKATDSSSVGHGCVEEDGEQSPTVTPSSARNSAQLDMIPCSPSTSAEELIAALDRAKQPADKKRTMSVSGSGIKTRGTSQTKQLSSSPRADASADDEQPMSPVSGLRAGKLRGKSHTISGRRKNRAALASLEMSSPPATISDEDLLTISDDALDGQPSRKTSIYGTLSRGKRQPTTPNGESQPSPSRTRSRLGSSSSSVSPPLYPREATAPAPEKKSSSRRGGANSELKLSGESSTPSPRKQLSMAQRLSFKNLLRSSGDKERSSS